MQLAELHDGRVEALSNGSGLGSEFVVYLSIVADTPENQQATERIASTPGSARRILVVDDNEDCAKALVMLLKITGHETHVAGNGLEAVEAARQFRPEFVLLDIGLPKLNGYDAARRIREQPGGKNIVLVALTGWGEDRDRRKSKHAGFDHHMVKPLDYTVLEGILASLPSEQRGQQAEA